ncbi:MAG: cytochrome c biogenesis protein ResB [Rectinemataceae bacterium]|nr:cytochrome c biogenesis protein ResB [Rectinemataceae bacterium]
MKSFSDKIYDGLRSVKLAAVLIVLIAIFAIAGGTIPQGRTLFSGKLFLLLTAFFTVNLTVCSFHRCIGELKKPRKNRRHGPDFLHIGLIVLIFGAMLTVRTRTETFLYLSKGQVGSLPDGSKITLTDLKEERYPDGRPKSWESSIATEGGTTARIKVNSPLRIHGWTIYQQDWKSGQRALFEDAAGMKFSLEQGARLSVMGGSLLFMEIDKGPPVEIGGDEFAGAKVLLLMESDGKRRVLRVGKGDEAGPFSFEGFETELVSGLKIVKDKGYPFVAAGLALAVLGLLLTYIRKLKGMLA